METLQVPRLSPSEVGSQASGLCLENRSAGVGQGCLGLRSWSPRDLGVQHGPRSFTQKPHQCHSFRT